MILFKTTKATFDEKDVKAHLILFQRDENDLLKDWVDYHELIFGAPYIHIIDHGSRSVQINALLQTLEGRGIDVVRVKGPFSWKAMWLTRKMHEIKLKSNASNTFLVPIDVDEFLVKLQGSSFTTNVVEIVDAFMQLPRDGFKIKFAEFNAILCNRTAHEKVNRLDSRVSSITHFKRMTRDCFAKAFYLADSFVSTDAGNHFGHVRKDRLCSSATTAVFHPHCTGERRCFHFSDLAVVHFGHEMSMPIAVYEKKMLRSAAAYGHTSVKNCTSKEGGIHYCQWLQRHLRGRRGQWHNNMEATCRLLPPNRSIVQQILRRRAGGPL